MATSDLPSLGQRIREERINRGVSLRALAGEVGVSASMISQIENGKSQPSVSTLYAITSALGVSIQEVFDAALREPEAPAPARTTAAPVTLLDALGSSRGLRVGPVVHAADRQALTLDTGVIWERLGELPPHSVDFLMVTYPPGGTSASNGGLMRHDGAEFGYLISGELVLTLGFEEIHIAAGDSFSFESTTPHSYRNDGTEPAVGVWFVAE
ncbi:helix-turn-helix domain-containing protein [Actinophytocola sp.]|uniref:helix-turn-helix domain-containing protein n=1 Tax=Actinophytocola sp. TaxID=1872138 RepID=UPI002D803EBF|nr:cupin domain-containing protein [Actinophytocola sp.]HET9138378.1 cupin domain-containing protein [Actinophytocola sp.]HEU5107685.1 cupin domain-containing protein [Micromonosporaceae bacterium]